MKGMRGATSIALYAPDVYDDQKEARFDRCNRFIEFQAFGGAIPGGQEISMRYLPDGLTCHHAGDLEDPDFNNNHVRITRSEGEQGGGGNR